MLTPWSLNKIFLLLFVRLLFAVLGTKPRALHRLSEHSTTRLYPRQNEIFLRETLASQLFSCHSLRAPPISEVLTVHWMNACLADVRSTHAKNQGLQKRTNKKPEWCNIALAFGDVRQVHEQLRQVWIELWELRWFLIHCSVGCVHRPAPVWHSQLKWLTQFCFVFLTNEELHPKVKQI